MQGMTMIGYRVESAVVWVRFPGCGVVRSGVGPGSGRLIS